MNEEQIARAKFRRRLILEAMETKFQDNLFEYLEEGNYESMQELDEHVDEMVQNFEAERNAVRSYYKALIDS